MRIVKPVLVGCIALSAALFGVGVSAAGASPTNAPTSITGEFTCYSELSGTFVVNTGNASGVAWGVAHLTFNGGGTAIFVPTFLDLTFSVPGEPPRQEVAQKGGGHPSYTDLCHITASQGSFSLEGDVWGKIVMNG